MRDVETLATSVVHQLQERRATLATAESLTGGLLGAAVTRVPGASVVYRGGIVAYATDLKAGLLGVDAPLLEAEGAVHPEVARQMAWGAADRLAASYGVATTGVAGPAPQEGAPVGTVHLAVAGVAGEHVRQLHVPGDRDTVRREAVRAALELLLAALDERAEHEG